MKVISCHSCGSERLKTHTRFKKLYRVSSDCKPWSPGGNLATCFSCGLTQATTDNKWLNEIKKIYAKYSIYYQGMGEEQKVFDVKTGAYKARSEWILDQILAKWKLGRNGKALDIGCGNGAFLKAMGARLPHWNLYGTEYNKKYKYLVEKLPRVRKVFTGDLKAIHQKYELISLIHVLEHIVQPENFLVQIKGMLAPNGLLFLQVPFHKKNPFELLTVDHASHFSMSSIRRLLNRSGLRVVFITPHWVKKEISLLAVPDLRSSSGRRARNGKNEYEKVEVSLQWLERTAEKLAKIAKKPIKLGIFGTSIAATWLVAGLKRKPDFYVDEDPARIGGLFQGKPIVSPRNVQKGAHIFLAQPPALSKRIWRRIFNIDNTYHLPAQ
jgi:SAM-dependent methyltransferase